MYEFITRRKERLQRFCVSFFLAIVQKEVDLRSDRHIK